ncbi:MAG: hypothetical protein JWM87_744 [Candidatus Eremiobacteraeota bacterium]|nr:hypothetical protein [Candidatus Eremiobacteraeota bacterium]
MPAPDVRVSVWKPDMSTCYTRDCIADFAGGRIVYEDSPGGCGAGELGLGLYYEQVEQRGYYTQLNIVEVSTGDDVLAQTITSNLATNSDSLSGWSLNNITVGTSGPGGSTDFEYAGTGSASPDSFAYRVVSVTAGQRYSFSVWVDNSATTSGNCAIQLFKSDLSTVYQQTLIPAGSAAGRFTVQNWLCPGGVTQVALIAAHVTSAVVAVGQKVKWSRPMFEAKSTSSAWYVPAAATTRVYVSDNRPYDTSQGEDQPQLYLWDGAALTMGIPVVGSPGLDPEAARWYLTCNAPLTMPGNPGTIGAYGLGAVVGRRRYAGVIRQRQRTNDRSPRATVRLGPLSSAFDEVQDGYTVGGGSSTDVTTAIYQFLLNAPATRWPQLSISAGNFAGTTGSTFSGNRAQATVGQMINDALSAVGALATAMTGSTAAGANTVLPVTAGTGASFAAGATITVGSGATQENCVVASAAANSVTVASTIYPHANADPITCASPDKWFVRVGHDRAPRMVRLYRGATNAYTYNLTLAQGTHAYEPVQVQVTDQDCATFYNAVLVNGNTNPSTQQPYSALVVDWASVNLTGRQIDGPPQTITALTSDAACAAAALGLLDQFSLGQLRGTFRLYTRNDFVADVKPQGLSNGDAVRGVNNVTITNFETGASNVFGLVTSVVTTLDFQSGDAWQDVAFQPFEPDWNAALLENGNAIATALHAGVGPGGGTGQYSVSPNAFPPTYSSASLVLATPAFTAVFGPGGTGQTAIPAHNTTLPASATSWIWLQANLTWTTTSTPSKPGAGAILYGYATTSAIGILGFTPSASVELLWIPAPAGTSVALSGQSATVKTYSTGFIDISVTLPFTISGTSAVDWIGQFQVLVGFYDPASLGKLQLIKSEAAAKSLTGAITASINGLPKNYAGQASSFAYYFELRVIATDGSYSTTSVDWTVAEGNTGVTTSAYANQPVLTTSAMFNAQGSMVPFVTDINLTVTAPAGQTYITASTNAGSIYRADGTTVSVPARTQNSSSGLDTTGATTYYVAASVGATSGTTGTMSFTFFTGTPTIAQQQALLADGYVVLITPAASPRPSGGGSGGGSGKRYL